MFKLNNKLKAENNNAWIGKIDLKDIFIGVFALILIAFFLMLIIDYKFIVNSLFFIGGKDAFMDYFNIADNVYTLDPYNSYSNTFPANYPAIAYLIILPFSLIGISDFKEFSSYDAKMQDMSLISFILYIIIALIALFFLIYRYLKFSKKGLLISFIFIFTYPLLFTLERANIIIYSFVFLLIYFNFYKSEKKLWREIAIISLAIAAGLKFYNALYIILLFKNGKILSCLRFGFYFSAVFFLPFLAFKGGFDNIPLFINNFSLALSSVHLNIEYCFLGHNYSINALAVLAGITDNYTCFEIKIFSYILLILSSALSLFFKEEWKTLLLLTCVIMLFPVISYGYVTILFLPPLICLINENKISKINILSLLLIIIILSPIQTGNITHFESLPSRTNLICGITIFITCIFMIYLATADAVKTLKKTGPREILKTYIKSVKTEFIKKA